MTKKTKAETQREEEAQREVSWNKFCETYPERFAAALYNVTMLSGVVFDGSFKAAKLQHTAWYEFDVDHGYSNAYCNSTLPANVNEVSDEDNRHKVMYAMDCVEDALEQYFMWSSRRQDREVKRAALMNKLTTEEKELLGL